MYNVYVQIGNYLKLLIKGVQQYGQDFIRSNAGIQ